MATYKLMFVSVAVILAVVMFLTGVRWVIQRRDVKMARACIYNLEVLDEAKHQWAIEHHADSSAVPTLNDLRFYINSEYLLNDINENTNSELPLCPAGGRYTIGRVADYPTCSLAEHMAILNGIEVRVLNASGHAVAGARVGLDEETDHESVDETDSNGWVAIKPWPNLSAGIILSKEGYIASTNMVLPTWADNSLHYDWPMPVFQLTPK